MCRRRPRFDAKQPSTAIDDKMKPFEISIMELKDRGYQKKSVIEQQEAKLA
jgi:hypothetical protein